MNNNNNNYNNNNENYNNNQQQHQQQPSPILEYQNYQINIIVVGNRNTGKSEFLNRYCELTGMSNKRVTEIKLKRIVKNDKYIRFRFYDVGEFYKQLNNSYLGVLFIYDTTNYQSFENIKNHYYQKHYLKSRKSNIFVINNKNSNDQFEEEYDNYLNNSHSSGNHDNLNKDMDELFFKVFRNSYLRNLIYSFKKKDIIVKYLIGTKLDLKNNSNINNSNNLCNINNSINKYSSGSNNSNINIEDNESDSDNELSSTLTSTINKHVSTEEAKEFAKKMGAKFYEVSSIEELYNINQILNEFTDKLIENYELYAKDIVLKSLNNNRITNINQNGSRSTIINQNNITSPPSLSTVNNRNNLSSVYFRRKCILN